jgi:hypothetical protein
MLDKNRFGTELYRSQRKLSREFGVSYSTIRRMIDRLERGHQFGRTNIVRCEAVLSLAIPPNMRPGGKLRRTATYELHAHRLAARMTEQQYEESSAGALCPFPPESSRSAPRPPAPQPKAEPVHRSAQRSAPQPKLSKRECSKLVADVVTMMRGSSGLTPNSAGVFAPMNFRDALAQVCALWKRAPESVAEALKFWGFKFEESEGP